MNSGRINHYLRGMVEVRCREERIETRPLKIESVFMLDFGSLQIFYMTVKGSYGKNSALKIENGMKQINVNVHGQLSQTRRKNYSK